MKRSHLLGLAAAASVAVVGVALGAGIGAAHPISSAVTTTPAATTTAMATTTTSATTTSKATTTAAATAPKMTSPPTVSGKTQVGQLLTADTGKWSGTTPMSFAYQWRICGTNGGACHDIPGATGKEYSLKANDEGNTLRVVVTAKNAGGSTSATSVPTGLVAAAAGPAPAPTGCPKLAAGATAAAVADVAPPARLQIDQMQAYPNLVTLNTHTITVRVHVSSTCGSAVEGASVYATGVPYNMVSIGQSTSNAGGWATMRINTLQGFPATPRQQLLVMFARATKPGENALAGISTRRLVSFRVNLHG
jgi:hypothetical protein